MSNENHKINEPSATPLLLLPAPIKNGQKTDFKPEKDVETGLFVPGNTGGPGRPVGMKNFTTKVREALGKLGAKDPQGNPLPIEEALVQKVIKMALDGDRKMIELIWNYLDGKPSHTFNQTNNVNNFVTVVMSAAEEKRIEDLFEPKEWPSEEVEILRNTKHHEQPKTNKENGPDNGGRTSLPESKQQGSAYEGSS